MDGEQFYFKWLTNMKYDWIKINKKRTVRNSCHGKNNWKKGVDFIRHISGGDKRETKVG